MIKSKKWLSRSFGSMKIKKMVDISSLRKTEKLSAGNSSSATAQI